eukprot:6474397-Pyramimonas_sp.AAC.1
MEAEARPILTQSHGHRGSILKINLAELPANFEKDHVIFLKIPIRIEIRSKNPGVQVQQNRDQER